MEQARWSVAYLGQPPGRIFAGDGDLTRNHAEFSQDSQMWSLFYYHHANAITLGTHTYMLLPGDMVFIAPGSSCSHASVGPNHWCDFMRFELPATSGARVAIPHVVKNMESHLPNLRKASNKIVDSPAPSQAFLWNLLWMVSESLSLYRESEELYLAEDFIRQHIATKFSVDQVAEAAQVSPRTLLKLFRSEHGVTVQEFVLRMRVKEASRLLLKSNLSIKEVAARVGMSDLQYFNKTMRTQTGRSPSKLRDSRNISS